MELKQGLWNAPLGSLFFNHSKTMDAKTLALYLGCQARVRTKSGYEQTSKLNDVDLRDNTAVIGDEWCDVPNVRLILRPLSSMTEEEAIEIGDLIIGRYDSVKFRADKKEGSNGEFHYWRVHRDHRGYEKSLCIDAQGEVDVYEKTDLCVWNGQHKLTTHLLSKGFDILGIIEKGEAIDSTKL